MCTPRCYQEHLNVLFRAMVDPNGIEVYNNRSLGATEGDVCLVKESRYLFLRLLAVLMLVGCISALWIVCWTDEERPFI